MKAFRQFFRMAVICLAVLLLVSGCTRKESVETGRSGKKTQESGSTRDKNKKDKDEEEDENPDAGKYTLFAAGVDGVIVEADALELSGRLVLDEDGTGSITFNGSEDELEKWKVRRGKLTIVCDGDTLEGTAEDGVVTINAEDGTVWYFAKKGADTSHIDVMDSETYAATSADGTLEQGKAYFYGTGDEGYNLEEAFSCFETAAANGNAEGWYYLGQCYERMGDSDECFTDAMNCYTKAIDAGCALGYYGKGELYRLGRDVLWDFDEAAKCYEQAISEGCIEANLGLGLLYEDGMNVELDYDAAKARYEAAMSGKDFGLVNAAKVRLAYLHVQERIGASSDVALGVSLIQEAADAGFAHAYHALGYIHEYGYGVPKNLEKKIEYYEKAGELGWANAYTNLGLIYMYGKGVDVDMQKAIALFETAGSMGNPRAFHELGVVYSDSERGYRTAEDMEKAANYYAKAIRFGYAESCTNLGLMYISDDLGEPDYAKAADCFKLGALGGSAWSTQNLGWFYSEGLGVEKDVEAALDCFRQALILGADDEDIFSYVSGNLQMMVENGDISEDTRAEILAAW